MILLSRIGLVLITTLCLWLSCQPQIKKCIYEKYGYPCNYNILSEEFNTESGLHKKIIDFGSLSANKSHLLEVTLSKNEVVSICEVNNHFGRHGKYTHYYDDGEIYLTGKYVDNKVDSIWKHFYPNGNLQRFQRFHNGRRIVSDITYDSLGRIKKYCMVAFKPICEYSVVFDENGKVISEVGDPWVCVTSYKGEEKNHYVGEKIQGNIFMAQSPNNMASIRLDSLFVENGEMEIKMFSEGFYYFSVTYYKSGTYKMPIPTRLIRNGKEYLVDNHFLVKVSERPDEAL